MTYQESFATALRLKDFVCLHDDKAWIYFIFTSETEFYLQIFKEEPIYEVCHNIQYELFYVKKLPMACVSLENNREVLSYRDQNLQLWIDLNTGELLHFDGEENTPIDMNKVRKSFKKLIA